tara:strand:- start:73 stop:585 length:513 start_codon:yes stop_codon:yes gene_type:complete
MSEEIIKKIKTYINKTIRPPREEFGGMPTCPFAGPELDGERLMIDVIVPGETSLIELIENFLKSGKNSALFAQISDEEISSEETKQFQILVNRLLKKCGARDYKCICFNPNDKDTEVNGFNPRASAPYFLINIARRDELEKAHEKLRKTKYYDHLNAAYLKFLKVEPKKS